MDICVHRQIYAQNTRKMYIDPCTYSTSGTVHTHNSYMYIRFTRVCVGTYVLSSSFLPHDKMTFVPLRTWGRLDHDATRTTSRSMTDPHM